MKGEIEMEFYKVTQGSELGRDYYFRNKVNAENKEKQMNELIQQFVLEGKNVDTRKYIIQSFETED